MKYILKREKVEEINEFINLKNIWNKLKFALGSVKNDIDKIYSDAFNQIVAEDNKKIEISKKYYELLAKSVEIKKQNTTNSDISLSAEAIADTKKAKDTATSNYIKFKNNIIKNLNLKVDEIIKKENNPQLTSYAKIKRYDLELELVRREQESFNSLVDENTQRADEELKKTKEAIEQAQIELSNKKKLEEENAAKLIKQQNRDKQNNEKESAGDTKGRFSLVDAKSNDDYLWEGSPYMKYKFEPNEEILYWSVSLSKNDPKYKGTKAFVVDQDMELHDKDGDLIEIDDNQLKVSRKGINDATEDDTFIIHKGKIIKTLKKKENNTNNGTSSTDGIELELPK